jgi:hypothetical protein
VRPALPSCAGGKVLQLVEGVPGSRQMSVGGRYGARAATSNEVAELRREARALKEVVVEQALELRLPKKSMIVDGGDGQ